MPDRNDSRASRRAFVAALAAVVLAHGSASAQDLEPRAYGNLPIGLNFVIAGYGYSTGDFATDASLPIDDVEVETHTALVAYARSIDVFGMAGKLDVVLPWAGAIGTAELLGAAQGRDVGGLADPRARFTLNFYGAPALSFAEYQSWEQDLVIGASFQVSAPLGHYDDAKLLNVGTNRWFFKPELGVSKRLGRFTLELAPAVTFYTDNDDFLGERKREQAPLFSVQGHVVWAVWKGIWLSLDGTWYTGGETTIDGVDRDDAQSNARLGGTLALPVTRHHSIKLYASTMAWSRTDSRYDVFGIAWQVRWGGGL